MYRSNARISRRNGTNVRTLPEHEKMVRESFYLQSRTMWFCDCRDLVAEGNTEIGGLSRLKFLCLAATRQRMASDPVPARIQVIAGDFFKDSIPEGYDAVIIANIVYCFAADRVLHLLRRVREHVSAEARILLVDFWTDPTHTQPVFAALMAGEFLLTPGGGGCLQC